MSDLYNFVPWVSFVAGFGGGLHCVGMCGGLLATCSHSKVGPYGYQLGRLLGYSLLGLLAGSLGHIFGLNFTKSGPGVYMSVFTSFLMGGVLIYWGMKNYKGQHIEISMPKTLRKFQGLLWRNSMVKLTGFYKGFAIGSLSIFLPCGLLYGAVISIASFQSPFVGAISMMTFWLGTLPALLTSGEIFKRILIPLKEKLPRFSSLSLVLIGVITIFWRIYMLTMNTPSAEACH